MKRYLALLALLIAAARVDAQSVRGTVVDRGGVPVPGVVVQLVDSADAVAARALTDERGGFLLHSQRAGAFRVRTLRIGFRPALSDAIALKVGEEVARRIELTGIPVALASVRVAGRSSCGRAATDSTSATFAVWEQVRAALTATQLTGASKAVTTTSVLYRREMDPAARQVIGQQALVLSDFGAQPWLTFPVDSLRRAGYVTADGDSLSYRAPGLDMLVSDEFIIDHCFKLIEARDNPRLGISFEPISDRKKFTEIKGTLWLDRATSELRSLEYRYVNVEPAISEAGAGGAVDFAAMKTGAWVITRWNIRMPVLVQRRPLARGRTRAGAMLETIVSSQNVVGGELSLVTAAGGARTDTLWAREPLTLLGSVVDSASGKGIADARVSLRGTALGGVTEQGGRFELKGALPGSYTIEVRTASLDSVNAVNALPLTLVDSATPVRIRVPNAAQISAAICGPQLRALPSAMQGIVSGVVTMFGDTLPARNASMLIEWVEGDALDLRWKEARTDQRGNYRFCGVPVGRTLVVRATADSGSAEPVAATIARDRRFARADLAIDPSVPGTGSFTGVVFSDSANQKPLAGAEVTIPALSKSLLTNERGAFRLRGIPAGTHEVVVRRVGYGAMVTQMTFRANESVQRRVILVPMTTLGEVNITAERMRDPLMRSFEENRKLGLGHFLTRDDLERKASVPMTTIMAELPGVALARSGRSSKGWVGSSRGRKSLNCKAAPLKDFLATDGLMGAPCCYAAVYLDNKPLYRGGEGGEVPNMARFSPSEFEAVEYYASAAQTPARYSDLNSGCGVIVLHTRRTP